MDAKLAQVADRFEEVNRMLGDPEILADRKRYQALAKEHKDMEPVVDAWNTLQEVREGIVESRELANDDDPEMAEMAAEELTALIAREEEISEQIKFLLLPKDPLDGHNIFLEIRAGTGGDEAALFAANLFRMYGRYAEANRWKVEIASENNTEIGGYKEVIANISGNNVYSCLKWESGVHRVQRVPQTESSGRIHTSTVTVAILPEADEVDVNIQNNDLRIDVFRSSGPGGQSVNTTDSAVRITHIPSGLVVICQDEKSQHKNKAKALRVLRSRLLDAEVAKQHNEIAAERRSQVGTGGRSERIRTYNYPENRVTDHRIGLTVHRLDAVLEGDINLLIEPMRAQHQADQLKSGGMG